MVARLRLLTLCAISAAKLLLCMRRRSNSLTFLTSSFLRPLGKRCRVWFQDQTQENWRNAGNAHLLVATITYLMNSKMMSTGQAMQHTFGIGSWPLNRRLTLLSIPFGFRHASLTLWYRSDWWRLHFNEQGDTAQNGKAHLKGFVRFLTIGILTAIEIYGQ